MKVLVTGAAGMLGTALVGELRKEEFTILATDIDLNDNYLEFLDVRNLNEVRKEIDAFNPNIVFHLAAETSLEICEKDQYHAYKTNFIGTQNVALVCQQKDIEMVYISTAGVFDGRKESFYTEFDDPNPINVYGDSKFQGEKIVERLLKKYFIARAGWMVGGGEKDKKFVAKIIQQIKKGAKTIYIVNDKYGTPTYTHHFSENLLKIVKSGCYGLYHLVNEGKGNRLDIAKEIVDILRIRDIKIVPVDSSYFKKEYFAPRPYSEMLSNYHLKLLDFESMPTWQEALQEYIGKYF